MRSPTHTLQTLAGTTLEVVRPSIWKQVHELRHDEHVIGSLTLTSLFRYEALATCDDGTWTVMRNGVLRPRITVQDKTTGTAVVEIPVRLLKHTHTFTVPSRRRETFTLTRNLLATQVLLTGAMDRKLVSLSMRAFGFSSGTLVIGPRAGEYEELPWMVFLVWYVALMANRSKGPML